MPEVYYQILVYETAPNGNAPEVSLALGQDPERSESTRVNQLRSPSN